MSRQLVIPVSAPETLGAGFPVFLRKRETRPDNPLAPSGPDGRIGWAVLSSRRVAYRWSDKKQHWVLVRSSMFKLLRVREDSFEYHPACPGAD